MLYHGGIKRQRFQYPATGERADTVVYVPVTDRHLVGDQDFFLCWPVIDVAIVSDAGHRDQVGTIDIGSEHESYTLENPFTAGERIIIIDRSLREIGMKKYFLIPIPDLNMYAVWVVHVESLTPPIDIVYTNNSLTKRLFSERGYYVKSPTMYDRDKFSGTKIRQKMINGENWIDYIPEEVAKVIEKLNGVNRLQELG